MKYMLLALCLLPIHYGFAQQSDPQVRIEVLEKLIHALADKSDPPQARQELIAKARAIALAGPPVDVAELEVRTHNLARIFVENIRRADKRNPTVANEAVSRAVSAWMAAYMSAGANTGRPRDLLVQSAKIYGLAFATLLSAAFLDGHGYVAGALIGALTGATFFHAPVNWRNWQGAPYFLPPVLLRPVLRRNANEAILKFWQAVGDMADTASLPTSRLPSLREAHAMVATVHANFDQVSDQKPMRLAQAACEELLSFRTEGPSPLSPNDHKSP